MVRLLPNNTIRWYLAWHAGAATKLSKSTNALHSPGAQRFCHNILYCDIKRLKCIVVGFPPLEEKSWGFYPSRPSHFGFLQIGNTS
jgi:hypothetical protein